jgi:hypothetical protein
VWQQVRRRLDGTEALMTYNRRVKRLRADWDGTCHIDGEPDELRCKVVDISMLGLGVTLKQSSPSELAGRAFP